MAVHADKQGEIECISPLDTSYGHFERELSFPYLFGRELTEYADPTGLCSCERDDPPKRPERFRYLIVSPTPIGII